MGSGLCTPQKEEKVVLFGKETVVEYANDQVKERFMAQVWPGFDLSGPSSSSNEEEDNSKQSSAVLSQKLKEACEKEEIQISMDESGEVRKVHILEKKEDEISDQELEHIVQLLRAHEEDKKEKQVILCFVDGSDRSHLAFETAKKLIKYDDSEDQISVVTVESEKKYLGSKYLVNAIKTRYESELIGILPSKRWNFFSLQKQGHATKDIVKNFVNTIITQDTEHPDPTFVVVGFSGRKSSQDRDPTVIGQVADLSLRTIFCPCIVVKGNTPLKESHRHFLMLINEHQRCLKALHILTQLLHSTDTLTLLHASDTTNAELKTNIESLYAPFAARAQAIQFISSPETKKMPNFLVQHINEAPHFKDVDFVCVASRPKKCLGSISDSLVRSCLSSIILIKTRA